MWLLILTLSTQWKEMPIYGCMRNVKLEDIYSVIKRVVWKIPSFISGWWWMLTAEIISSTGLLPERNHHLQDAAKSNMLLTHHWKQLCRRWILVWKSDEGKSSAVIRRIDQQPSASYLWVTWLMISLKGSNGSNYAIWKTKHIIWQNIEALSRTYPQQAYQDNILIVAFYKVINIIFL